MHILVIDDEPRARNLLVSVIRQSCSGIDEIYQAEDLSSGVALIKANKPQLVFLDIEMPNEQGIKIFDYFEKDEIEFELVFATAYNDYALKAFEMNAIDYLLKPIRPKRIIEVVEKVQQSFNKENIQIKLEELRKSLLSSTFTKIGFPVNNGILFISIAEIIHLEADGMYTKVYTQNNGNEIISKPLKFFNYLLEPNYTFYRPHRSHIFNLTFLKQFVRSDGNYIILDNDDIVPLSNAKREEFLALISALK